MKNYGIKFYGPAVAFRLGYVISDADAQAIGECFNDVLHAYPGKAGKWWFEGACSNKLYAEFKLMLEIAKADYEIAKAQDKRDALAKREQSMPPEPCEYWGCEPMDLP